MKISVGSKNPTKIEAATSAFAKLWPAEDIEVVSVSVPSGVSAQPRSDIEAATGARNRALAALVATKSDFGVGLEGGINRVADRWFDSGWAVVMHHDRREGVGTTIRMPVPPPVMQLVDDGLELGVACDKLFSELGSKSKGGFFGALTNGALDRSGPYRDAVIAALSIFLNSDLWYPQVLKEG